MLQQEFDLVIVGGGVIGLCLAQLLGKNTNLTIAIIEPKLPQLTWSVASFDSRCLAINHASQDLFQSLGIWEEILSKGSGCYTQMQVWDASGYGNINFSAAEIKVANLGYVVENRVLLAALWNKIHKISNITIIPEEYIAYTTSTHTKAISVTTTNKTFLTNLLVAADGAKSRVREQADITSNSLDYQQTALVATIVTELAHNNIARQRFLPDGPLAFLPLANQHHCSIVWTSSPDNIKALLNMEEEKFCNKLTINFSRSLGKLRLLSSRISYPLNMLHANQYFVPNVVLVGDAAHVIHPLAGQGVNLGLQDVKILAEEIIAAVKQNRSFYTTVVLRNYDKKRRAHNLIVLKTMSLFKEIFGSSNKLTWFGRNLGLNITNHLPLIKKSLMRQALLGENSIFTTLPQMFR